MENVKIAIIGAGIGGLACALECEKLGVIPDVYERDNSVGWIWCKRQYKRYQKRAYFGYHF
ncbi:MAG TPA: NAD(P)-binding protein, partial [Bacillota bacterium]|nr:NAD(P)-binding protein [Bacillota bacterium]